MLTLTDRAAEAISTLTRQSELPTDSAGLRIVAHSATEDHGRGELSLSLAQEPQAADAVVESGDARVFLETEAAQALDHQQLDATVGADGGVKFLIAPQA